MPIVVTISPAAVTVAPGQSQDFYATCEGGATNAVWWSMWLGDGAAGSFVVDPENQYHAIYTAAMGTAIDYLDVTSVEDGFVHAEAQIIVADTVTIAPGSASVPCHGQQQFTATTASGAGVLWSVAEGPLGGTIDAAGLYTAPATVGTYHVRATSTVDPDAFDTAEVTTFKSLTVAPGSVTLPENHAGCVNPGLHQQAFTATLQGFLSEAVTWSIVEGANPALYGSVDASGTYTAPNQIPPGAAVTIRATSDEDPTYWDDATVQVVDCSISVTPEAAALGWAGQQAFAAVLAGHTDNSVTWAVDEAGGGSVDAAGLYTAPAASGTFTVRGTSLQHAPLTDTAEATVALTVAVTEAEAEVVTNRQRQLTATVTGGITDEVTWSVEDGGGTVTGGGLYTAPSAPGTYTVTVRSDEDPSQSATVTVRVYIPTPWALCTNGRYCLALLRELTARDMTWANLLPEDLNANDLRDLINESYVEAARQALCLVREATATVVEGQALYDIPSDACGVRAIQIAGKTLIATKVEQLPMLNRSWRTQVGWPRYYYIQDQRQVGIWPIPRCYDEMIVEWFVFPVLNAPAGGVEILTADADVPKLRPISHHMLLVHGAVERLCTRRYAGMKTAQERAKAARADWDHLMQRHLRWAEIMVGAEPEPGKARLKEPKPATKGIRVARS